MSDAGALLEGGLAELGLALEERQVSQLLALGALVDSWGRRINLTGHRGVSAILQRLVLDSLALVSVLPDCPSLADLGSGAGFPGLPAAILRPGCRVTLVESREKRHHFQRAACRALGLVNATPLRGRAEDLVAAPHAAVVAQAIAKPPEALRIAAGWVEPGGLVVIPGTAKPPVLPDHAEVRVERIARYRVPCGGPARTLWIGRKIG